MTMTQLTEFLGWAALLNIGYLLLAIVILMTMGNTVRSIHSKLLKIDEEALNSKYFDFLSYYKIVTVAFMIAPYLALKIMGY